MLQNLTISSWTIRKKLSSYTPKRALIEYIENWIDAWAKNIEINFKINRDLWEYVEEITIKDDWKWINYNDLYRTFEIYWDSQKTKKKHKSDTSWKDWHWRLTFFVLCTNIEWITTFNDIDWNKNYSIKMNAWNLQQIDIPESNDKLKITNNNSWTIVTFNNILPNINEWYLNNEFINELYERLAWRLILQWVNIYINNYLLSLSDIIELEVDDNIEIKKEKDWSNINFDIKFIKWKRPMKEEESRYYFLNSKSNEVYKMATSFNRWWDEFYHSIYIKSSYFDNFIYSSNNTNDQIWLFDEWLINQHDKVFLNLKKALHIYLWKKRKPFIEKYADYYLEENFDKWNFIEKWDSLIEKHKYELVRSTFKEIYLIEPKFLSELNQSQLWIFARLIDVVISEGESTKIFDIIDKTLKLSKEDRENFAEILKDIELSNIIKTIDIIKDRFKILSILEEFVFNKDLKANEIKHLQTLISKHYWIFWEEYNLIWSAEIKFEENLRRFLYILRWEKLDKSEVKMNDENKNKEMDIFMCKVDRQSDNDNTKVKNIIVELKHPNINLSQKEFIQVIWYMTTILKEDKFNWKWYEWRFYLIWNKYDETIKSLLNSWKTHWKDVIHYDSENNYKVYCKTWSDVIEENKTKLNFIKKQLDFKEELILKETTLTNANEWLPLLNNWAMLPPEIKI